VMTRSDSLTETNGLYEKLPPAEGCPLRPCLPGLYESWKMISHITSRKCSSLSLVSFVFGTSINASSRRIYIELADQYKEMDAASDKPKRNLLADHLREVVDVLEQKVRPVFLVCCLLANKQFSRVIK
jgi:hypothetical protein